MWGMKFLNDIFLGIHLKPKIHDKSKTTPRQEGILLWLQKKSIGRRRQEKC